MTEAKKSRKGFASMTPEQRSRIASMGGKAAHQVGTAHKWSSDEARAAGKRGGLSTKKTRSRQ